MHICIKCTTEHDANFCPNCGQLKLNRIEWKQLVGLLLEVVEMHRGLTHNIKELTLRPNKFATNYLSGLTKGVMNPFSYLVVILTSLTFIFGSLENYRSGISGLELLDVQINWRVPTSGIIPLFLLTGIFCLISGRRLLDAIILSTFFISHYCLLISVYLGLGDLVGGLGSTVPLLDDLWKIPTLFVSDFMDILLYIVILAGYSYFFFKPTLLLPSKSLQTFLKNTIRVVGLIILVSITFIYIDVFLWGMQGVSINSNESSGIWEETYNYSNWYKLKERSEKQTNFNNYLLQLDSSSQDLHRHVSIISQRLDSLKNYIFKDSLEVSNPNPNNISPWLYSRPSYTYVLDSNRNPHLSKLKLETNTFNELLLEKDSNSIKYEINLTVFKDKNNADVLCYLEGKKQELLTIESLLILESLNKNKKTDEEL